MVGSSYPYKETTERLKTSESRLKSARAEFNKVNTLYTQINDGLQSVKIEHPKKIEPILDVYTRLGYDLKAVAPKFKVLIQSQRLDTNSGADADLQSIPQPFALSKSLKWMGVKIEGTYEEYDNFKGFLAWLDTNVVAINKLTVVGNKFTMTLDIYGE